MKINELKDRVDLLQTEVRMLLSGKKPQFNSSINDLEYQQKTTRGEDGEYDDTRELTGRQVLDQQKQMLKNQDNHIDEIHGIVQNMKLENQNFQQEVTYQNKLLDKVSTDLDKN